MFHLAGAWGDFRKGEWIANLEYPDLFMKKANELLAIIG